MSALRAQVGDIESGVGANAALKGAIARLLRIRDRRNGASRPE